MKTIIKWTKAMDTDKCKCYKPDIEGLMSIWWYRWEGYTVGDGRNRKRFSTLKEAKEYVSSLVK